MNRLTAVLFAFLACVLSFFQPLMSALATSSILCNGALVDYASLIAYLNNPSFGGGGTFANLTVTGNSSIGGSASSTLGFYGATPVVQRASAATHTTIATTVALSTTTGSITSWGFSTSTQANALTAAVAEIQATLVAYGLWAA